MGEGLKRAFAAAKATQKKEKCPACGTALKVAPGIGPYCPNKECGRLDDLR